MRAIGGNGHRVSLASSLRTFDGRGDAEAQRRIKIDAESQISGLLDAYEKDAVPKPDAWFTYHLYHKAPDWIGPAVADALAIPYVVAEASLAPKQAGGPWDMGHRAVLRSLDRANLIIGFNPVDAICVRDALRGDQRYQTIPPFIDLDPYTIARAERMTYRAMTAGQYGIPTTEPWLMTVAMMRYGDKLASYEALASALAGITDIPWRLLIAGSGEAQANVHVAFKEVAERIVWLGRQDTDNLPGLYAAADLYVWPAINEAFGMAFLEAQSSGLPVIAGDAGGVAGVVHAPDAGVLVPPGDPAAMADAIRRLLGSDAARRELGETARAMMENNHSLFAASQTIGRLLSEACKTCA